MLYHSSFPSPVRKKFIFAVFAIALIMLLGSQKVLAQYPAGSPVAINGKLQVIGTHLSNECGNPVQLRGMATHGVQWFQGCYTPASLDMMVNNWKIDILRISMYIQEGGYQNNPAYWRGWIDNLVDECGKRGIYVVIDWHVHLPGDPLAAIDDARFFWNYMSQKHKNKKHVLYEICNEPNRVFWGTVQTYANDIIPRIRANDPTTVIICGSSTWSQDLDIVADDPLIYPNLIYSLHFYAGSHGQSLRDKGNYAMSKGIAIIVTEFGTSDAQNSKPMVVEEAELWMSWMRDNKISWMNWSYSDKDEPNSALKPGSCGGNWDNVTPSGAFIKNKLVNPAKNFFCDPTIPNDPVVVVTGAYNGTPFPVPGKIEGEFYDKGGNNFGYYDATSGNVTNLFRANDVDIEATNDVGGGYDIGWVDTGEWLKFSTTVAAAGKYDISLRVSVESAGKTVHIESNNVNITGSIALPKTGSWSIWQTVTIPGISLAAGNQVLKLVFETGGSNFNWMDIQPSGQSGNTSPIVTLTSPSAGAGFTAPAAITISAAASDADGTISKVEFRNGAQLIGTALASPYTFSWNNVAAGSYSITATASDNSGAATISAPVAITVTDVPVVTVATPYNGIPSPVPGKIEAEWYDKGGQSIGYSDNSTSNAGGAFRSDGVDIEASTDLGAGYNIGWTAPDEWLQYTINVAASDKYDFNFRIATAAAGKTLHLVLNGSDLTVPIEVPYTGGWQSWQTFTIPAIALDQGVKTLRIYFNSGDINFNYFQVSTSGTTQNQAPVVAIGSPSSGFTASAPATINLSATASDPDGTIAKVEFFNGTTLLGQATAAPYVFAWTGILAGSYSISARATDNAGTTAVSVPVSIVVTPPVQKNVLPQVALTAPAAGTSVSAPASIVISATASDADGTISKVEFLNGNTVIGQATASPYTFTWTGVAAGTYSIAARATDNVNGVVTTAAVTVVVNTVVVPGNCPPVAVPLAAQWVVRNDWNDQTNGSSITNSASALVVTHRQWGRNKLWAIQTGKSFPVVKGQTYTIKLDISNDASNPVSSIDVAIASGVQWDSPVLAQPIVSSLTGLTGGSYTSKNITFLSNYTGNVNVSLGLNWPAQPNKAAVVSIKNIAICNAAGTALRLGNTTASSYELSPNPFETVSVVTIKSSEILPVELSVNDVTGNEILHTTSYNTNEAFNLGENLSKGVYIVKAVFGTEVLVFSFIKL